MIARTRPTIATLMGLVALAGLGIAAVRTPDRLRAALMFSATLLVLFGAGLAAVFGPRRAFWGGFLAAGTLSLLVHVLVPAWSESDWPDSVFTIAVDVLFPRLHPGLANGPSVDTGLDELGKMAHWYGFEQRTDLFTPKPFERICLCLMSLGAGLLGGLASAWAAARSRTDRSRRGE